jgi:hypothetical protein
MLGQDHAQNIDDIDRTLFMINGVPCQFFLVLMSQALTIIICKKHSVMAP